MQVEIEINEQQAQVAAKNISFLENEENRKTVIEAADSALVVSLRLHFAEREKEPHVIGWWNRGLSYPKRYFWRGTRTSVSDQIRTTLVSPQRLEAQVSIDSPALKHKLDQNPQPIRPKGGRKYLAIPASPQAAQWTGTARDFPYKLRFERWRRPDGSWISALIARQNFLTKGGRMDKSGRAKLRQGQGQVVYWLVHQVRTRHDPSAMPSNSTMSSAVNAAVSNAIRHITRGQKTG